MNPLTTNEELLPFLQGSSRGDQAAFQQLYQRTSPTLYSVALKLLHRRDWADEILQEAYVKIWHNASEYLAERGTVLTWMISILRYRAIDRLRREKAHLYQGSDYLDSEDFPEGVGEDSTLTEVELHKSMDRLQGCMDELGDEQKRCIAGAYFSGLTHVQISTQFDTPVGTVKSWIRRGLILLRRCLER